MKSIIAVLGLVTVTQVLSPAAAQTAKAPVRSAAAAAAPAAAPQRVAVLDPFALTTVMAPVEKAVSEPVLLMHQHNNPPGRPDNPGRPHPRSPHRPDHDRGHGNDPDHDDEDNPGQGQGGHGT